MGSKLMSWQFNVYAACMDGMLQMLNDVWNGLVNEVKTTKHWGKTPIYSPGMC